MALSIATLTVIVFMLTTLTHSFIIMLSDVFDIKMLIIMLCISMLCIIMLMTLMLSRMQHPRANPINPFRCSSLG